MHDAGIYRAWYSTDLKLQANILTTAESLSSEDHAILIMELLKTNKLQKEQTIKIKNLLISEEKRLKKQKPSLPNQGNESGESSMTHPGPSTSPRMDLPAPVTKVFYLHDISSMHNRLRNNIFILTEFNFRFR